MWTLGNIDSFVCVVCVQSLSYTWGNPLSGIYAAAVTLLVLAGVLRSIPHVRGMSSFMVMSKLRQSRCATVKVSRSGLQQ